MASLDDVDLSLKLSKHEGLERLAHAQRGCWRCACNARA